MLRRLLRKELLHFCCEVRAAGEVADLSSFVDAPHRRDAIDAEAPAEGVFPAFAVEILGPGHRFSLHEGFQRAPVVVETDAAEPRKIDGAAIERGLFFSPENPQAYP
jgi:hypothetical protein